MVALGAIAAIATLAASPGVAVPGARCPGFAAARALARAERGARYRYDLERVGLAVHVEFRRIEHDRALTSELAHDDLAAARARAGALLVNHVVRIRIGRGARVIVDANAGSFAVGGSVHQLRFAHRTLGQLEVTVQDVTGYVKLVREYERADVVVRGSSGRQRTSLARAPSRLPASGCAWIGGHRYAVGSFAESGFARERLTIWVLVPA